VKHQPQPKPQPDTSGRRYVRAETDSTPLSVFDNALWFNAHNSMLGNELYKLGADGSFTFWKDINPGAANSNPHGWVLLA